MSIEVFSNPFRPGAGQPPPYLAGRESEQDDFLKLLNQNPVIKNVVLTGLRGVGKTVLLETFKPIAIQNNWFWAGADLSESSGVSEQALSIRILADISVLVSSFTIPLQDHRTIGFTSENQPKEGHLSYNVLVKAYNDTPGLEADKLKFVLELVWNVVKTKVKGIVLAYDEAQILKDKAADKQYPLSLLLEVVQYLQRKQIPYLLILTGLPTLFPNLVEARTYAERMFQVITLDRLSDDESKQAILRPINKIGCPVTFSDFGINEIIKYSSGYPYFIQFFCKETFDTVIQQLQAGVEEPSAKVSDCVRKLDSDFYAGRWSRITDKQRDLLSIIAKLPSSNKEFTAKEISELAEKLRKSIKPAYVNNLLNKLIEFGLIYKNRRGRYSFAVPLLADFINRQEDNDVF
jgi:hypothetical protein